MLETYIDPEKSKDVDHVVKVTFSDIQKSWALHVRRSVAEVSDVIPEKVDATVSLPRLTWANIVLRQTTLKEAVEAGTASIEGDEKALATVISSFDQVSSNKPEPHDLHN